jgi:hypothetical protein
MEIIDLAQQIANKHGIDPEIAVDVVRVHLDQIRDDPEFWTPDGITPRGARLILGAVFESYAIGAIASGAQRILDDLADAAQRITEAIEDRDGLIRAAMRTEVPRKQIAKAAGLSPARIHQIKARP